jgi:predicted dehydrogenase
MPEPTRVGILGCGVISGIYIESSKKLDAIECVAVADVNPDAARYRAEQYQIPRALSPEELLADPEVEIVVNLTPNRLHAQVSTQILESGKHVYSEKPLAVFREESQQLLALASQRGLRVGNAPDTFLGGAWQTARRAIDEGLIGQPFAAFANFHGRRSATGEQTAPRPSSPTRSTAPGAVSFFQTEGYKYGVTVHFDMGPYYLHSLVNLLGPAQRVVGATRKVQAEAYRFGQKLAVEAPTHQTSIVEFANGAVCQFLTSSDVLRTGLPHVEIYGTEGSLRCPDPNYFLGPVLLRQPDGEDWVEVECRHALNQDSRGVGVADLALAIRAGRPHRASGEMGAHVVDVVNAIHESAEQGRRIDLQTTCQRPAPLPTGLPNWTVDAATS